MKDRDETLQYKRWSGQGTFTLNKFISVHCNSYGIMNQCDEHVDYQVTNELTYADFLINDIKCKDPGLNADIAMVKGYRSPTGKMNKFEDA